MLDTAVIGNWVRFVSICYSECACGRHCDVGRATHTPRARSQLISRTLQVARKTVPFPEAVSRGLVDRETGSYVNNATGERVFAAEAIRRGLFKAVLVSDPSSLSNIDASNRLVVERIERRRKNVVRNMRTIAAFRQSGTAKK